MCLYGFLWSTLIHVEEDLMWLYDLGTRVPRRVRHDQSLYARSLCLGPRFNIQRQSSSTACLLLDAGPMPHGCVSRLGVVGPLLSWSRISTCRCITFPAPGSSQDRDLKALSIYGLVKIRLCTRRLLTNLVLPRSGNRRLAWSAYTSIADMIGQIEHTYTSVIIPASLYSQT